MRESELCKESVFQPNQLTNTQAELIAEPMDLFLNKVYNERPLVASSSNISYADSEEIDKNIHLLHSRILMQLKVGITRLNNLPYPKDLSLQ